MISELVLDAYGEMEGSFIPQVIREMSTVALSGEKLVSYELVLRDFESQEARRIRSKIEEGQDEGFRYISYDNSVPSIVTLNVRYAGRMEKLADRVMGMIDNLGYPFKEPVVAPGLSDLVFKRVIEED